MNEQELINRISELEKTILKLNDRIAIHEDKTPPIPWTIPYLPYLPPSLPSPWMEPIIYSTTTTAGEL